MREVSIVTGPLRSGTSCLTGLLELCGFDLGKTVRVMRTKSKDNPEGHFEPDLLVTINNQLLSEPLGNPMGMIDPPPEPVLRDHAAQREKYFRLFLRKFDGEVCKDPMLCLTLPFWEQYWPELQRAVFCLRHPLAVARSIERRYEVSVEQGFEVWKAYTARFFAAPTRCKVYVFDFDAFCLSPLQILSPLLTWLGRPGPEGETQKHIETLFNPAYIAKDVDPVKEIPLPEDVSELYAAIRSRAGATQ